jgi:hypothetical protein
MPEPVLLGDARVAELQNRDAVLRRAELHGNRRRAVVVPVDSTSASMSNRVQIGSSENRSEK